MYAALLLSVLLATTVPTLATASASACDAGEYYDGSICKQCGNGMISESSGATHCKPCPTGKYTNYGRTECISCNAGFYINNRLQCRSCNYNSYSTQPNLRSCTKCELHEFTQYEGSNKASDCENCGRNAHPVPRNFDVICQACDQGRYYLPIPSFGWECQTCPEGTSSKNNGGGCQACKIGSFAKLERLHYQPQRICHRCDEKSYNDKPMASACKPCPSGSIASEDRTHCVATCNPRMRTCQACPPGEEPIPSKGKGCRKCPSGTASPFTSKTPCVKCSDYFKRLVPNSKQDRCICGNGKAWFARYEKCRPCPRKTALVDGACVCRKGEYFSDDAWECMKM